MKHLVVDTSNLLFRVAAANVNVKARFQGTKEEQLGLAMHSSIMSLNKYFKQYKPDRVVLAFEGRANWRKEYTRSSLSVSKVQYKANRVPDPNIAMYFDMISQFKDLVQQHSSLICLHCDCAEGDDMIAAYTQKYAPRGDEITVLSGDRDFFQLLKYPNVDLIDPATGKSRRVDKAFIGMDPEYFIFEKCFRGDSGDNVMSAYPKVRSTRLKKAYEDEYERVKLMNETWISPVQVDGTTMEYRVGDLYNENVLLMDLEAQPHDVKEKIAAAIERAESEPGTWSLIEFSKFCGRYKLKNILESVSTFAQLFNHNAKTSKAQGNQDGLLIF